MRHLFFALLLLFNLTLSAQKDVSTPLFKKASPLPESGAWLNTRTTPGLKAFEGRTFQLITFWTAGDPESSVWSDLLNNSVTANKVILQYGVHIPKKELEKDSAFICNYAHAYGLQFPHYNDLTGHYYAEGVDELLPRVILIHPDGTEYLIIEGGENMLDQDVTEYIHSMVEETKAKYNGPGKKLFPASVEAPPIIESAYGPLSHPYAIEVDGANELIFISDTGNDRIIICTPEGKVVDCIGSGSGGFEDGHFRNCELKEPKGLSYDPLNNELYIADYGNNSIRVAKLDEQKLITISGDGTRDTQNRQFIKGRNEPLNGPIDVLVDGYRLIVTMTGASSFWELNLQDFSAETLIGSGRKNSLFNKKKSALDFAVPGSMVIDSENRILFSDVQRPSIYTLEKGKVIYLMGEEGIQGLTEGDLSESRIISPNKLIVKRDEVYLVDTYASRISKIEQDKNSMRTLELPAGDSLCGPTDIDWINGSLIVCDQADHQILIEKDGTLQGIKFTNREKLNTGMRKAGALNMRPELTLHSTGQNTIKVDFELPDDYMWDIDNESILFTGNSEEIYMDEKTIGPSTKEIIVFADKLRFQITLRGELNFCSVLDPTKCFHKNLNVVIPVLKSEGAKTEHEISIELLPELKVKPIDSDPQSQGDDWLKY